MEKTKKSLYIVIIGCGRLGSHLANILSKKGHSTVIVDNSIDSFEKLDSTEFSGFRIEGDATELSVLKEAKINKADVVIGVTESDNINIMIGQIAKNTFSVKSVLVRIQDQNKIPFLNKLKLDYVCTTEQTATEILSRI
ncbi:MAG: TrkA family potassium uptake protein [Candidatus Cloacimonetes bacterium]|nr:TrkA family potassium uptake protein [Candidatus Cloacimonadota bacterium]